MLRVMLCWVVCVVVVVVLLVVWCDTLNNPVCTFKTSPCMPATRAHAFQHERVLPAHTERFGRTHRDVLDGHTGGRGEVIVSFAYPNLPT